MMPPDNSGQSENKRQKDNFYVLNSVLDLAAHFMVIECSLGGQEISYHFPGKVTVDGVEAEHILVNSPSGQFELWIDGSGRVIKGAVGGMELPGAAAQGLLSVFVMLDTFFHEQRWNEQWRDAAQRVEQRDLGSGPVQVTCYNWSVPLSPLAFEVEVAEIAGRNLVTKMWHVSPDGSQHTGWRLNRVLPRIR
jgi:hypothetical protein